MGKASVRLAKMPRTGKQTKRAKHAAGAASRSRKVLKNKEDSKTAAHAEAVRQMVDPQFEQQLKIYEQAVQHFHQQKFAKAKELLEKVDAGPSKELGGPRAEFICALPSSAWPSRPRLPLRTPEEHYQAGVAMMNLGRWDEARDHLLRARKLAPKADFVFYAMAALDCLTGEAESAMENLKTAIQLRPENRYHARNDEDFAFLQEDPRFTELLYPEREASGG